MRELHIRNTTTKALVDDEDYERLTLFIWNFNGRSNIQRKFKKGSRTKHISLASEIMNQPGQMFDHKDRNCFNCLKNNLRPCNNSLNAANKIKLSNTKSKFKGVTFHKLSDKWKARIKVNQKEIYLGLFNSEIEAAISYNKEALKYFGEFAVINII